jgi:23S rRNA (adenine2503-C2)-methyltransferase
MQKRAVLGLLPQEIAAEFSLSPPFRGQQVFSRLWRTGAESFAAMTDLPLSLRACLEENAQILCGVLLQEIRAEDGAVKSQVEFAAAPGERVFVESVLLADRAGRKTACVSSQAGCALGCAFCKTGRLGLKRSLSAAEIAEQFLRMEKTAGRVSSLVFMGMGEPLLNLEAVRQSIAVLTHPAGRNLSLRRVTISTAGIIEGIYRLAEDGPGPRLAVSLTTADQTLRRSLMPVAGANPLSELQKAILHYAEKSGRRCTLEAVLLSGVNTDAPAMKQLAAFAKKTNCHVNLIPWNAVQDAPFTPPSADECRKALAALEDQGVNATLRTSRAAAITGACGQLGAEPG